MEKKKNMEIETLKLETTPEVFKNTVHKYQDRVALRKKEKGLWVDLSWNEYYKNAAYIGSALISMGLKKGDCASIIGDNCVEWVFADMAIQCAGGTSVGIYSTNAWPQVEYVTKHSDSKFLFVENEEQLDKWMHFKDNLKYLEKVIVWDLEGLRNFNDPNVMTLTDLIEMGKKIYDEDSQPFEKRMDEIEPGDTAVLVYTSGTTGLPKGAMLSHRNVTWMATTISKENPVYDTDNVLSFLPLCHIFERLFSVFAHLANAYTVNFVEKPNTVTQNMVEISPSVGYAVPRIWEKYSSSIFIKMSDATFFKRLCYRTALKIGERRASLKMDFKKIPLHLELLNKIAYFTIFRKLKERMGFDNIRVAYSGAAPISPEVLLFFQAIDVNLIEGYGQTETTGVTCTSRVGRVKIGTVGPPLPDVELKIAEDGEILVKSPGVFKGYFKNQKSTDENIVDGWLFSGDVGRLDEDGYLIITDRKKDIIVTAGGKNITPQFIENKMKASPYINDAVVIGDKRKYLTSLIMIDEDNVVKFAQDNKVQFSTYKDLTMAPEVNELIWNEVVKINQTLSRVEQVKKITIIPKKLFEEDGEVTPTMKIKRKSIHEGFAESIESMY